jgi:carboxyl-terminal processing protease
MPDLGPGRRSFLFRGSVAALVAAALAAGGAAVTAPSSEGAAGGTGGDPGPPDPARRAYVAARVYSAIQLYFAHWDDVPQLDLDAAFQDYLGEALSGDRRAFSLASSAFVARLGNSHTFFHDRTLLERSGRRHGFGARYLGGRWVITGSERPELRPGDVIETIDGEPMEDFYRRQSRYVSASTERHRRRKLFDPEWRFLFPLRYALGLADGRTVPIDREGSEAPPALATEGRWLDEGRTATIRVPSWNDPKFEDEALALLGSYRGAAYLIVDVRGNHGGSTPDRLIRALMDRPWRGWAESTPMRLAVFSFLARSGRPGWDEFARPQMAWPASTGEPGSVFTGRLAILVDEACHSACEDFAMPFKDNGRATLVGETTAGSTGQPYFGSFGDGMSVAVGAKRESFPDGRRFEGVGIEPDVRALPTPSDLAAGRDVELETALALPEAPRR